MFTQDNTQGFTDAELDTLNTALERLMEQQATDDDDLNEQIEKSLSDKLNNEWRDGITAAELVASAT